MERFVFVRCSWMERYAGDADDVAVNGGSYVTDGEGPPGERFNFLPVKGKLYGRLQSSRHGGGFNLDRIHGQAAGKDLLKEVCVIFVATPPKGHQRVVGWYSDAVVYAEEHDPGERQREDLEWNMRGTVGKAVLLPINERVWEVPAGEGGMGMTQVRYPLNDQGVPEIQPWMRVILKKIAKHKGGNLLGRPTTDDAVIDAVAAAYAESSGQGFMADAEARRVVEELAMRRAIKHFGGPKVVSDHHLGSPYDLSVLVDGTRKYIEVKGTTSEGEEVLLTPGEVRWARQHPTMLFALRGIMLSKVGGKWKASGGTQEVIDPWVPADDDLRAITYWYRVPAR